MVIRTGREFTVTTLEFPKSTRFEIGGDVAENPRIYDLIKHVPKRPEETGAGPDLQEEEGKSPTIWAWPQVIGLWRVAGQPVPGPWPPHQEARPDPEAESTPVAIPERQARRVSLPQRPVNG
jgi:hypothetical protein